MQDSTRRIGIDYDGTIADTNRMKSRWIRDNLGLAVAPWLCDRSHCVPIIGRENYTRMSAIVYGEAWSRRAPPVAGAISAIEALRQRAVLFVVTARLPERVPFARRWLEAHGLMGAIEGIVSTDGTSKERVCAERGIEVLIDDDERHLAHTAARAPRPLLLRVGYRGAATAPAGVELYDSWPALLSHL